MSSNGSPVHINTGDYRRHPEYYIDGADFHILARDTYFPVHSYFLDRESDYWRRQLRCLDSSESEELAPGSHESIPFILDEDPEDFVRFLWVFYNPRYDIYEATPDEWVALLRLATKWGCPNILDFTVSHIKAGPMETFEKVEVFQNYGVPIKHYFSLLVDLASRDEERLEESRVLDDNGPFQTVRVRGISHAPLPVPPESNLEEGSEASLQTDPERDVPMNNDLPPASPASTVFSSVVTQEEEAGVMIPLPDAEAEETLEQGDSKEGNDDLCDEWEILEVGQDERSLSRFEHYVRLPTMLHDFIIPYCLFISFMCALLA